VISATGWVDYQRRIKNGDTPRSEAAWGDFRRVMAPLGRLRASRVYCHIAALATGRMSRDAWTSPGGCSSIIDHGEMMRVDAGLVIVAHTYLGVSQVDGDNGWRRSLEEVGAGYVMGVSDSWYYVGTNVIVVATNADILSVARSAAWRIHDR